MIEELKRRTGQDIMLCFQCGECSSSCQMVGFKGFSPTKLMHLLQLGREDVIERRSYEACLHCFLCSVRCPQGLSFPEIATALSNIASSRYGANRIERAFLEEIASKGFVNPVTLALKIFNFSLLRLSGLRGLRLAHLAVKKGDVRYDLVEEVRRAVKES